MSDQAKRISTMVVMLALSGVSAYEGPSVTAKVVAGAVALLGLAGLFLVQSSKGSAVIAELSAELEAAAPAKMAAMRIKYNLPVKP